jgi:hypothetical protein
MTSPPTPIKNTLRLVLGIFIGTICGAVVASMILKLEVVRLTVGVYAFDFEIAFGRSIGEHLFTVLKILGALAGAAVGGSLAVSIRWFAVLGTLLVGIIIGGAIMFFVEVRVVKYVSGIWEQSRSDNEAFIYLQCLKAIERGATNQLYLVRFQNSGRMALAGYMRDMEKMEIRERDGFSGTNAPAYGMTQKYLATHTNASAQQQ